MLCITVKKFEFIIKISKISFHPIFDFLIILTATLTLQYFAVNTLPIAPLPILIELLKSNFNSSI